MASREGANRIIDAVRGRDWCNPATVYRAHRILHSRQDRRVTRGVVKAANGSAARNKMTPRPRQSSPESIKSQKELALE